MLYSITAQQYLKPSLFSRFDYQYASQHVVKPTGEHHELHLIKRLTRSLRPRRAWRLARASVGLVAASLGRLAHPQPAGL
jgi:hypothetical protein